LKNTANHLGLFSEEYDGFWREALGNFPQAFTHIGFVNSVILLCKTKAEAVKTIPETTLFQKIEHKVLVMRKYSLNHGNPPGKQDSTDILKDLKHLMNTLRGAYFRVPCSNLSETMIRGCVMSLKRQIPGFILLWYARRSHVLLLIFILPKICMRTLPYPEKLF
jgi:hypothetical protein